MHEISVRKQGQVYTVFTDGSRILPITSWDDEPAGFPSTFIGLAELKSAYPGFNFRFVERAAPPENTGPRDAAAAAAAAAKVRELKLDAGTADPMHLPLQNVPTTTTTSNSSISLQIPKEHDGRYLHAQEVLKRLEVAHEYASAKNKRELSIKITAVKELLDEVFK